MGAQINDLQRKLLICEESENDTFRFPWSKKPRMDFLRPYQIWFISGGQVMANVVIVGAQWGDEGKGKIVDVYAERADEIGRAHVNSSHIPLSRMPSSA